LQRGLRRNEFHVAYQPIVLLVDGVEALLRWTHPRWGAINPGVFMKEVERISLLTAVTGFVLKTATMDMVRNVAVRSFRIAVNVALEDLKRDSFADQVLAVKASSPEGMSLVLEVPSGCCLNPTRVSLQHPIRSRHPASSLPSMNLVRTTEIWITHWPIGVREAAAVLARL
jgi:EAL domain-containing protein (putative c-di-GMP-specific phosphodiesterase class I)